MPFKSSLMRSAGKLFGVSNQEDLDLRGKTAETRWIAPITSTGGTIINDGTTRYHVFLADGTFTCDQQVSGAKILLIGSGARGGGGGGHWKASPAVGGGGGAGGGGAGAPTGWNGGDATANTGGGAGGAGVQPPGSYGYGADGGSGFIAIRYPTNATITAPTAASNTTDPASADYKIAYFTSAGSHPITVA